MGLALTYSLAAFISKEGKGLSSQIWNSSIAQKAWEGLLARSHAKEHSYIRT